MSGLSNEKKTINSLFSAHPEANLFCAPSTSRRSSSSIAFPTDRRHYFPHREPTNPKIDLRYSTSSTSSTSFLWSFYSAISVTRPPTPAAITSSYPPAPRLLSFVFLPTIQCSSPHVQLPPRSPRSRTNLDRLTLMITVTTPTVFYGKLPATDTAP